MHIHRIVASPAAGLSCGLICCLVCCLVPGSLLAQPQLVRDIRPGPDGQSQLDGIVNGGQFFFRADNGSDGTEPWISDGTTNGTQQLSDLRPGADGSFPTFRGALDDSVFFNAFNDAEGSEIWSVAAFPGNPVVFDIRPGPASSSPAWLGIVAGRVLVSAMDDTGEREIWWVNRSGGPELFVDINGDQGSSNAQALTPTGGNTALLVSRPATPPTITGRPHRLVGDVANEILGTNDVRLSFGNGFWPVSGGWLFMASADGEADGREPWLLPNGNDKAQPVKDIYPGNDSGYATSPSFTGDAINGVVYFAGETKDEGVEPWRSDGTNPGTFMIADVAPGDADSDPLKFVEFNGHVYFGGESPSGPQLWRVSGSNAELVATLSNDPNGAAPRPWIVFDNHLIFRAETPEHGFEWWAANGDIGGVALIEDLYPGPKDGSPRGEAWIVNNRLLWEGDDGVHGRELWKLETGFLSSLFTVIYKDSFECNVPPCP
jgi:ELWxxDGT repeat protein